MFFRESFYVQPFDWLFGLCHAASALTAEIRLFDLRVVQKCLARIAEDDGASFQHIGSVCDFQGTVRVLFDEQNGDSLRVELGDDFENLHNKVGSKAQARFVEEEEL